MSRLAIILLIPTIVAAQAPRRFEMVSTQPRTSSLPDGEPYQHRAIVTMTGHDSAGKREVLFSTSTTGIAILPSKTGVTDPRGQRPLGTTPASLKSSAKPAQAGLVQVNFKANQPSTVRSGYGKLNQTKWLDTKHSEIELLNAKPGLSLLAIANTLPKRVGEVRVDTLIRNELVSGIWSNPAPNGIDITGPTGFRDPASTIATLQWTRKSADSVVGQLSQRITQKGDGGRETTAIVTSDYLVVLDRADQVLEATATITTATRNYFGTNSKLGVRTLTSTTKYELKAIP